MDSLMMWYAILSKSKYFGWAKLWALIEAGLLAALGYAWITNHFLEVVMIVGLPIFIVGSSLLESLSMAYRVTAITYRVTAAQTATATAPQFETATEEEEPQSDDTTELSDENKLTLCQFYVFLYLLFELREAGEGTFKKMIGMSEGRYRQWLEKLQAANLELIISSQGRTQIAEIEFEEALQRIAAHDRNTAIWDFPIAVYDDDRNWRKYDPSLVEVEPGRTARIRAGRRAKSKATLLPIYPTRLKELQIEFNF